jgi:hypothetical protein
MPCHEYTSTGSIHDYSTNSKDLTVLEEDFQMAIPHLFPEEMGYTKSATTVAAQAEKANEYNENAG